jgi:hypothetical protein
MDFFTILEQFGIPVAMTIAFGVFKAQVEIIARLSGNGLKDKFLRMMEQGGMTEDE